MYSLQKIVREMTKYSKNYYRYGKWGICFIYGTWFALGGLAAAGKTYSNCLAVRKGVGFLLGSQRDDGGWGESYLSCPKKVINTILKISKELIYAIYLSYSCMLTQEYVPLEGNHSNLVQTAMAMMGLIHGGQVSLINL